MLCIQRKNLRNLRYKKHYLYGAFTCRLKELGRQMTQVGCDVFIALSPWKCLPECKAVYVSVRSVSLLFSRALLVSAYSSATFGACSSNVEIL